MMLVANRDTTIQALKVYGSMKSSALRRRREAAIRYVRVHGKPDPEFLAWVRKEYAGK